MIDNVGDLVKNRLEHVDLIFDLRKKYFNPRLIKYVGANGWTHPWVYFDALMYYLLLTCFDLLGQNPEWVSLSEWLTSKKKTGEREAVECTIGNDASPQSIAQIFFEAYQRMYGVRSAFNHFILNLLTEDERSELFHNLEIVRGRMGGDPNTSYPALGYVEDESKKVDFLFRLRNKFTHSAVIMGSPAAGVFPDFYEPLVFDGKPMKRYSEIYREEKGGEWLIYQVCDWPFLLVRLITAVLDRR